MKASTKMERRKAKEYYNLPMGEYMMANGLRERKMAKVKLNGQAEILTKARLRTGKCKVLEWQDFQMGKFTKANTKMG